MLQPPSPSRRDSQAVDTATSLILELRGSIHSNLGNLGVISAFMCALAANIYAQPPKFQPCYGAPGLVAELWFAWFSMGFFFLSISATVLISADLDGVPDELLLRHLAENQWMHTLPSVLTAGGLFALAVSYGIDVDERSSDAHACRRKWLGVAMAPMFPVMLFSLAWLLRRRRGQLNARLRGAGASLHLGRKWLIPWADRIPLQEDQHGRRSMTKDISHLVAAPPEKRRVSPDD